MKDPELHATAGAKASWLPPRSAVLPTVLRSWTWHHTGLALGLALANILLGPAGGLLLWPVPASSKQYELALLMNFTMFGLPMVMATRCADEAVLRGARAGPAYSMAVAGVAVGGSVMGMLFGISVWGGQPANLARTVWLSVGIASLYGLGVAAYVHARRGRASMQRLHAIEAERAQLASDLQLQRLQALQSQVDSQLLFDTLCRVEDLAHTHASAADQLLNDLIALLRALLPEGRLAGSSVGRELELLRAHGVVLQRPALDLAVEAEAMAFTLAPSLLLPMVQAWHSAVPPGARARLHVARVDRSVPGLLVRMAPADAQSTATVVPQTLLRPLRERLTTLFGDTAALRSKAGPVLELELPTLDDYRTDR